MERKATVAYSSLFEAQALTYLRRWIHRPSRPADRRPLKTIHTAAPRASTQGMRAPHGAAPGDPDEEMDVANARHSRLNRYFDVYDTDRNGTISREDFELQAQRRVEALRLEERSPSAAAVRQVYADFWDGVRTRCDLDANGTVSRTEWIQVWDDVAHTAESFEDLPPWFRSMFDSMCRALFRGSAEMSVADLESFLKAVGRGDLKDAARRTLLGDKATLTRAELEALWFRYLCSDEAEIPDVLFG